MKASQQIIGALIVGGVFMAVVAGLKLAARNDLIAPDAVARGMQVMFGLALAAYANFMPKTLGRLSASVVTAARVQTALRIGGWCFMIAGVSYAAIWALAPMALVGVLAIPVMIGAMLITFGYAVWAYASCLKRANGDAAA